MYELLSPSARTAMRRLQRRRQDFSAYATLIATPGDLVAGFDLPASAEIFLTTDAVIVESTVLINAGSRDLGIPVSDKQAHHVGRLETDTNVVKDAAAPGTVSMYIRDLAGALVKIGEG